MRRLLPFLLLAALPARADDVPEDLLRGFNQLAREAEALLRTSGPAAAIARYEQALLSDFAGYGRVHLRLGQLYQQERRFALAARHYTDCDEDERVDAVDRELICQEGQRACTAPVELVDLPAGGQVVVLEPTLFAGPLRSGERVPLGPLRVVVEAPGHPPRESRLTVEGPLNWRVVLGEPLAPADVPDEAPPSVLPPEVPPPPGGEALRWPAWAAAGAGVALVGTGLWLGVDNRQTLDDIRDDQRLARCPGSCATELSEAESRARLADGLWIGGAVVAASSVLFWYLFDGDEP
ncbi:MAG: hypothetical protein H6706_28100 [Myxococcales bacterium]|nr:hypothetical protein [Myxococcales bacterium]